MSTKSRPQMDLVGVDPGTVGGQDETELARATRITPDSILNAVMYGDMRCIADDLRDNKIDRATYWRLIVQYRHVQASLLNTRAHQKGIAALGEMVGRHLLGESFTWPDAPPQDEDRDSGSE